MRDRLLHRLRQRGDFRRAAWDCQGAAWPLMRPAMMRRSFSQKNCQRPIAMTNREEVLATLRSDLAHQNFAFIPAAKMLALLGFAEENRSVIAREESLVKNHFMEGRPMRDRDTGAVVYGFQNRVSAYYMLSANDRSGVRHVEHDIDVMADDGSETRKYIAKCIDPTTSTIGTASKHHVRLIARLSEEADETLILQCLREMFADLVTQPIEIGITDLADADGRWSAVQHLMRITKSDVDVEFQNGEPSPEGIHQDECHLVMIMLWDLRNVVGGSNRVWSLEQPSGIVRDEDVHSGRLLWEGRLNQRFDALIMKDRHVKHQGLPFAVGGDDTIAMREVCVIQVGLVN